MADSAPALGLLIPNRGTIIGDLTVEDLLGLSVAAEDSGLIDSLWVGDSILAKPRLEAITLLSAMAARTSRVKLGPACFASFPIRNPVQLAYEWASLDVISGGRSLMVACLGGGSRHYGGHFSSEFEVFGLADTDRVGLFEENLEIVRRLWAETEVTHEGEHHTLRGVTIQPRPVQQPMPLWIASNPQIFQAKPATTDRALGRVARMADGWMTAVAPLETFEALLARLRELTDEQGRPREEIAVCVLVAANVSDDEEAALAESTAFLNEYYMTSYSREEIERWGVFGPADKIHERLRAYYEAGADTVIVRPTSWDQHGQLAKLTEHVLPGLAPARARS